MSLNATEIGVCRHCTQCGSPVQSDSRFCAECGASTGTVTQQSAPLRPSSNSNAQPLVDEVEELAQIAAQHPDDENYQKQLAVQLHDDAMKDWWKDPKDGSLYCTSIQQMQHAKKQLCRALALRFEDSEIRAELEKTRVLTESLEKRRFDGSWIPVIVLGFFYIIPGWLWWYVNRRHQFLINFDYVRHCKTGKHPSSLARMGGTAERVSDFFDSVTGGWGWIFSLAFMFICSPIMMILAYKENYLDVKKQYGIS